MKIFDTNCIFFQDKPEYDGVIENTSMLIESVDYESHQWLADAKGFTESAAKQEE